MRQSSTTPPRSDLPEPPRGDRPATEVSPGRGGGRRLWVGALTLAPLVFLLLVVWRFGVDVPYLDQWDQVPLLNKALLGQLTLADLWTPHNEHRIFFPQLILLSLARLTHWNIHYELGLNVLLASALFGALAFQVRATARRLFVLDWHLVVPAISLVVFSVSQYQNWLWGFQTAIFLNMLTATVGLLLLANPVFSWSRLALAAALGGVATFSFGTGVVFWPVGLMLVWLLAPRGGRRIASVMSWLALSGVVLGLFFRHYGRPAESPGIASALAMPLECGRFLIKYIGSLVAQCSSGDTGSEGKFALVYGLAALAALVWAVWRLLQGHAAPSKPFLPYLALCGYGLGSGVLTALGRVCLGSDQAASSRYCTMVVPLWTCLIVFLFFLWKPGAAESAARPRLETRRAARWCLASAVLLSVISSALALDGAHKLSVRQANGRAALLTFAAGPSAGFDYGRLSALNSRLAVVVDRYPVLKECRLSLFRDP